MATLSAYLKRNGIEQERFAELAGVHPSAISRLVNGKTPTLATAIKIVEASGGAVTFEELADPNSPPPRRRSKGQKPWSKKQKTTKSSGSSAQNN